MSDPHAGMVEKRGPSRWLTHAGLILGVLFIFFPIWLAFVASTVSQPEIVRPPMPLLPGDRFFENYRDALLSGVNAPVARMLMNSAVMAVGIALGKIVISLLSARLRPWSRPPPLFHRSHRACRRFATRNRGRKTR